MTITYKGQEFPDRLLTRAETAAMLGVAEQTLANWHTLWIGPDSVLVGSRARRYRLSTFQAWIGNLPSTGTAA